MPPSSVRWAPPPRLIDLNLTRARYEAAGGPAYWTVDPETLELTAWELVHGAYVEVAHVAGDEAFRAEAPFAVDITPSGLLD